LGNIDEDGNYQSAIFNDDKRFGFHMSALSGGRALFSFGTVSSAINALTIALRYACTRKQFENFKKDDETLIIDYQLTKNRLIP
jgi:acyl-CoA oxidase